MELGLGEVGVGRTAITHHSHCMHEWSELMCVAEVDVCSELEETLGPIEVLVTHCEHER